MVMCKRIDMGASRVAGVGAVAALTASWVAVIQYAAGTHAVLLFVGLIALLYALGVVILHTEW